MRLFVTTELEVEQLQEVKEMPGSSIRTIEWKLVGDAMQWKIGDIWSRFQEGQELPIRDQAALNQALAQMYGSE